MRVRPSLLSHTKGFSLIEMLLCVGILGILLWMALPRASSFSQKECLYTLRAKLLKAQDEFFAQYLQALMTQSAPQALDPILHQLARKEDPQCYFELKDSQLIAFVQGKRINFLIEPKDFSYKPKIYCQLSNSLCREFWGKEYKK
ncbi:type II secretion system protein [uncultured Helicobacter sp.]|uniref:type II secretion system protein n=1 Tax=uncultured Helicobacter sp. TaxID=175537 RepID=UPI00341DCBDB